MKLFHLNVRQISSLLAAGAFCASSAAIAQTGVPFAAVQQEIAALNNAVLQLQAALNTQSSRIDSLVSVTPHSAFVRWGSGTAPAGTTLVQTGLALSGYFTQSGSGTPVCRVINGQQGPNIGEGGDPVYVAGTGGSPMPPGIQSGRQLKCAVALAERVTTVIWGSSAAPAGWNVVYSGYAFGAHYTHANPLGRICVDSVDFDATLPSPQYAALYYPTWVVLPPQQGPLKCAVIVKAP